MNKNKSILGGQVTIAYFIIVPFIIGWCIFDFWKAFGFLIFCVSGILIMYLEKKQEEKERDQNKSQL